MSKKNKKFFARIQTEGAKELHTAEYQIIKHDLLKILVLNIIYLAGVMVLYFTNVRSFYLERWFARFLHF